MSDLFMLFKKYRVNTKLKNNKYNFRHLMQKKFDNSW